MLECGEITDQVEQLQNSGQANEMMGLLEIAANDRFGDEASNSPFRRAAASGQECPPSLICAP